MSNDHAGDDSVFAILGLERRHQAQLLCRPMATIKGVRRTLVMGVVEGNFTPDGVDRRVDAFVTIKVVGAESAKQCTSTLGRRPVPSYTTEGWSHGSLLLEGAENPDLWEAEPGFPRPRRARSQAERSAANKAAQTATATWDRVLFVKGYGYYCNEDKAGVEWSDRQKDAWRLPLAEVDDHKDGLLEFDYDVKVRRLRPRAK